MLQVVGLLKNRYVAVFLIILVSIFLSTAITNLLKEYNLLRFGNATYIILAFIIIFVIKKLGLGRYF